MKACSTYRLIPSTIDTTAIRNITPMVTPRSVKKLFSFWARICARASRMLSRMGIRSGEPGAGSLKEAGSRKPGAGSLKEAGSRKPGAGSREPQGNPERNGATCVDRVMERLGWDPRVHDILYPKAYVP